MKTAQIFIYTLIIVIVFLRAVFHADIPYLYPLFMTLIIIAIILKLILLKIKK